MDSCSRAALDLGFCKRFLFSSSMETGSHTYQDVPGRSSSRADIDRHLTIFHHKKTGHPHLHPSLPETLVLLATSQSYPALEPELGRRAAKKVLRVSGTAHNTEHLQNEIITIHSTQRRRRRRKKKKKEKKTRPPADSADTLSGQTPPAALACHIRCQCKQNQFAPLSFSHTP